MPTVNWLQFQLEPLLEAPYYKSLFASLNASRASAGHPPHTPQSLAKETAVRITSENMLSDPVRVKEVSGPLELYRGHDNGEKAPRLGICWFGRDLIENFWLSTAEMPAGQNRQSHFRRLMRSCNLVDFKWNGMTHLVGMRVKKADRIVVIAAEGSWRALVPKKYPRGDDRRPQSVADNLKGELANMATEPTTQYLLPLFDEHWVQDIPQGSSTYPLLP